MGVVYIIPIIFELHHISTFISEKEYSRDISTEIRILQFFNELNTPNE